MAEEDGKPNAERLREYRQSNRESLEQMLFSEAPIYDDLETLKLADGLSMFVTEAGADNELVVKVLDGKSPRDRAAELIQGSRLKDVAVRRELAKGGKAAIEASKDPMIQLALLVDGPARKVRRTLEEQVDEPLRQAYAKIAKARFAVSGTEVYPDATFTLRLAFGVVKGYDELGQPQPPWTTLGGAYQHSAEHQNREPFNLPKRWLEGKDRLNLATPLEFRFHRRHHRRQFGQPRGQSQGAVRGHHLRRQPGIAGLGLHLHGESGPGHRRPQRGHRRDVAEAVRCRRRWRMNWENEADEDSPLHLLGSLLVLAVFAAAAWLLASELRKHD